MPDFAKKRCQEAPEKGIFQPLHNYKKSVLSIKESFSMGKKPNIFTNAYGQAGGVDPPPLVTGSMTVKKPVLVLDLLIFCSARPGYFDPCLSLSRPAPKIFTLAPPRPAPWEKTLPRPSLVSVPS